MGNVQCISNVLNLYCIRKFKLSSSDPSYLSCLVCTFLSILCLQEAIVKIMKMRKKMLNAALQTELVEILKNMFIPPKKMIKEQIEWLIEHRYMKRDDDNRNLFVYLA